MALVKTCRKILKAIVPAGYFIFAFRRIKGISA
jgi:hypothetical protein